MSNFLTLTSVCVEVTVCRRHCNQLIVVRFLLSQECFLHSCISMVYYVDFTTCLFFHSEVVSQTPPSKASSSVDFPECTALISRHDWAQLEACLCSTPRQCPFSYTEIRHKDYTFSPKALLCLVFTVFSSHYLTGCQFALSDYLCRFRPKQ